MATEVPALPFTFEVTWDGNTAKLTCHGRLVAGVTDGLYDGLKPLVGVAKQVVVDLQDVKYVDSMGIGVLVRLYVSARAAGCELRLTHLGKQVRNLFRMTNLVGVLCEAEDHGITVA